LEKGPLQATTVVGARCCAQRGPASSASAGANAALIHTLRIDFFFIAILGRHPIVRNTSARIAPGKRRQGLSLLRRLTPAMLTFVPSSVFATRLGEYGSQRAALAGLIIPSKIQYEFARWVCVQRAEQFLAPNPHRPILLEGRWCAIAQPSLGLKEGGPPMVSSLSGCTERGCSRDRCGCGSLGISRVTERSKPALAAPLLPSGYPTSFAGAWA
jgi:hypothetical protein